MVRAAILWLCVATPLSAGGAAWEPDKTWVFAVGVLQFDSPNLQTYPEAGRVDVTLIETLVKRGVPRSQVVFIKNEKATEDHIRSELASLLKKTGPGDSLLFYYTGHGFRDLSKPARPVNFVTYDTASCWTCGEIFDAIEASFQGTSVLMIADCCHSGGLAEEAARRAKKIGYGVLASAQPASLSTSNWTFTQCMVDLFAGHSAIDANQDGKIQFQEGAQYGDAEMCFCEDQRACHLAIGNFSPELVLARTDARRPSWLGRHCEAPDNGVWMKAKVIEAKDGMYLLHWVGRPKKPHAWRLPEQLRKPEVTELEIGLRVQIEWNGDWYQGKVMQTHQGLHLVHYDGYPSTDDEWVSLRRLRLQP